MIRATQTARFGICVLIIVVAFVGCHVSRYGIGDEGEWLGELTIRYVPRSGLQPYYLGIGRGWRCEGAMRQRGRIIR